jgi:uncharacterized protein (DUF736 family)
MLSADHIQHLNSKTGEEHGSVMSLFLKRFPPKNLLGEHYLLVQALRSGIELSVDAAWWLHRSEIGTPANETPLEFLRAFLVRYGNQIEVNGEVGTLLINVPLDGNYDENPAKEISYPGHRSEEGLSFCGTVWNAENKTAYVHVAYSVDIPSYRASLRELGAL